MTWVVLKIRTMPNAVSAYRLPSASPLTSSCPHGRSVRMSGSTESMRLPHSSFLDQGQRDADLERHTFSIRIARSAKLSAIAVSLSRPLGRYLLLTQVHILSRARAASL